MPLARLVESLDADRSARAGEANCGACTVQSALQSRWPAEDYDATLVRLFHREPDGAAVAVDTLALHLAALNNALLAAIDACHEKRIVRGRLPTGW